MSYLHQFNIPNCGLRSCTKCSTTPSWSDADREYHIKNYLKNPFPDPTDPTDALKSIKHVIEDIMESMRVSITVHWHDDGTYTHVHGPNVEGALYHLFNAVKNILIKSGIVPWEFSDSEFLFDAGVNEDSIVFEDFLDDYLRGYTEDDDQ
jgi:hypothetical protein